MSLIGEALKRARLEAARREGEERGTAHSSVPAYLPARRRSRASALAATLVAALTGAGAVYLFLRPASTPEPSARPPLLGEDKTAGAHDPASAAEPQSSVPLAAASATPPAPIAAAGPPPSSRAQPRDLGAGRSPEAAAPPPGPSADARGEGVAPAAGAKVYVRVAELGGTRLELDGIVASETDPVAMINRKLLGIGEGLDGWVVEKIEAKQVTLRGGRETVILKLR